MNKQLLAGLYTLLMSFSVFAQADLKVVVTSLRSGQPLEGITVVIQHPATGAQATELTNTSGIAYFPVMPARSGYRAIVFDASQDTTAKGVVQYRTFNIQQGQPMSLYVPLPSATTVQLQAAEVTALDAQTIPLNASNAEVSGQLSAREIRRLPVEGRDISRSLYRLPNVTQATGFYPEAPNVSINGANALFTNYLIDGMDNNENFLGGMKFNIPVGFTQNIEVLTSNYSARYGWSNNGVINITTPSGANQWQGEAFALSRPGPVIDGASPYAQRDLSGNLVKDGFQRYQGGFGVGGPIVKDRTFFYVNVEHTTDLKENRLNSPDLGINEVIEGTNRFSYLSARVDHKWNNNFRSFWRLHAGRTAIERQGGGLEGGVLFPSAGSIQDRNAFILAWHNTYVKNNFSASTNLQYSRFRWNYGRPMAGQQSQVTLLNSQQLPVAIIGHPGFVFDDVENTFQLQQHLSWYLGKHTIKVGGGLITSQFDLFGGGNVNGNYLVQLTDAQLSTLANQNVGTDLSINDIPATANVLRYDVEMRPTAFGVRQNRWHAFVTDNWQVSSRLTLDMGLRWSYDNLSKGGGATGDFNNIAPRFSANYRLSPRSVLRAGYGIYYDKIIYAVYSDALQQNTTSSDYLAQLAALQAEGIIPDNANLDALTFDGNLVASYQNVALGEGPTPAAASELREQIFSNERRILNPNGYANPYSHQLMVGYQLQITDHTRFAVDAMYNRGFNLFRLRNLNAPAPYPIDPGNVVVRTPAAADLTRPVPIFSDSRGAYALINGDTVRGVARNVVMTETAGESKFYGITFTLEQVPGKIPFGYRVTYTLSRLENNTDDINFRAQDANNFEAEWGPSLNDRTHVINAIFYYLPGERWQLTTAALLQSGQPINRIPDAALYGTTDLNGDGRSFGDAYVGNSDRSPGATRNSDRLPWSVVFDVSLQYKIPVGNNALAIRADVFNLFNAQNLSGYSNNATQSNQIQVGPESSGVLVRKNAGPPRQFQFGLRYAF